MAISISRILLCIFLCLSNSFVMKSSPSSSLSFLFPNFVEEEEEEEDDDALEEENILLSLLLLMMMQFLLPTLFIVVR